MKQYTLTEAARLVGMSRQGLWLNLIQGRVKYQKLGRFFMISEDEVEKFKERRSNVTRS